MNMKRRIALILLTCSGCLVSLPGLAKPLQPFLSDSYKTIIDANRQQPMLLVLWSLDCPPCREEMPDLADFSEHHKDVELVLVSVDGAESSAEVETILSENKLASVSNWIFSDPFLEKLRFSIDPGWQGELPRSYLYVPGEQRHRIRGRIDFSLMDRYLATRKQ